MFETKTIEVKTPITGDPKIDKANEKLARELISRVCDDKDIPKEESDKKIEIVKEKTETIIQHKKIDMFTAVKDAIAPAVEIALFILAFVLIIKYLFVVLGVDDPHCKASITDVWVGIGIVIGLLINDAINLKPLKDQIK